MTRITEWSNCYPSNWKGVIVPEAMAHPAKYSSKLIRRIYEHMVEMDWIHPGDKVLDPFGGVALGALDAMRLGLDYTGIELEAKFHELGQEEYQCSGIDPKIWKRYYHRPKMLAAYRKDKYMCPSCESAWNNIADRKIPQREPHLFQGNIPLWMSKFGSLPRWGSARLLNGDSRQLLSIIHDQVEAALSSPPYAEALSNYSSTEIETTGKGGPIHPRNYGTSAGQLGAMSGNNFAAALSSPPYSEARVGQESGQEHCGRGDQYGETPGQLGAMRGEGFNAAIASPPYSAMQVEKNARSIDRTKQYEAYKKSGGGQTFEQFCHTQDLHSQGYGNTDGQLSAMPAGDFNAAISSPPFLQSEGGTPEPKPGGTIDDRLYARHAAGNKSSHAYGESDGQLSDMKDGGFDAAISSPPYAAISQSGGTAGLKEHGTGLTQGEACFSEYGANEGQLGRMNPDGFDAAVSSPPFENVATTSHSGMVQKWCEQNGRDAESASRVATVDGYGQTPGNIGNDSGDDFWLAARQIVEQVYAALAPGGHAIWVVKDYVKNKKIVPFSDQWRQLCEAVGFVTEHEHHAMLVHHKGAQHTLEGGLIEHKTESKSFFRRLAEKNGSPRIDFETIYCMEKPS